MSIDTERGAPRALPSAAATFLSHPLTPAAALVADEEVGGGAVIFPVKSRG